MISNLDMFKSVQKDSIGGKKIFTNQAPEQLPKKVMKERKGKISQDEYLIMMEYSKMLPSGKRQLNINMPELRDTLISNDLTKAPLTKTSGLNSGGLLSLKNLKPKEQSEYLSKLKNKNTLSNNPVQTSFKNNINF
tara:strand:- start:512 stop:919 length:408 start_codon:yes stop_codon:yes gene_type:complete